jgi:hypothetical protein
VTRKVVKEKIWAISLVLAASSIRRCAISPQTMPCSRTTYFCLWIRNDFFLIRIRIRIRLFGWVSDPDSDPVRILHESLPRQCPAPEQLTYAFRQSELWNWNDYFLIRIRILLFGGFRIRIRLSGSRSYFSVHYSALLHLPPLRFHWVDGCWDRTQDRYNWCIGSQTL